MTTIPDEIQTWQMVRPWTRDNETGEKISGRLERMSIPMPEMHPDEVHTMADNKSLVCPAKLSPPKTRGDRTFVVMPHKSWDGS